jgi:hypothetical protein
MVAGSLRCELKFFRGRETNYQFLHYGGEFDIRRDINFGLQFTFVNEMQPGLSTNDDPARCIHPPRVGGHETEMYAGYGRLYARCVRSRPTY